MSPAGTPQLSSRALRQVPRPASKEPLILRPDLQPRLQPQRVRPDPTRAEMVTGILCGRAGITDDIKNASNLQRVRLNIRSVEGDYREMTSNVEKDKD